jgi:hypothetical protein
MWAILGVMEEYKNKVIAWGGLTVGNLMIILPDEEEDIRAAFDSLARNGWLNIHWINGVDHAMLKEK